MVNLIAHDVGVGKYVICLVRNKWHGAVTDDIHIIPRD